MTGLHPRGGRVAQTGRPGTPLALCRIRVGDPDENSACAKGAARYTLARRRPGRTGLDRGVIGCPLRGWRPK